jgi:hypothetical protein
VFCLGQFGDEERGVTLGNPKLTQARQVAIRTVKAAADAHAANVLPVIQHAQHAQNAGATTLPNTLVPRSTLKSLRGGISRTCPLFPQQRASVEASGTSALCQSTKSLRDSPLRG